MSNPFFDVASAVFPVLFLLIFGFVALIWSALLMLMFINTVRALKKANDGEDDQSDSENDSEPDESSSQPPPPAKRQHRKRNHVRPQTNNQPGTAAQHSLPPYISNN